MLKRSLTYLLLAVIVLTLAAGGAASSLAFIAPFRPGDALFPVQAGVEQLRLALIGDPVELAGRLLDLVERRLDDLEAGLGTPGEAAALEAVDEAFQQAVPAISAAPASARGPLKLRLAGLAARWQALLQRLGITPADRAARAVESARLILAATGGLPSGETPAGQTGGALPVSAARGMAAPPTRTPIFIAPHGVPFPPNATPGAHSTFALVGQHTLIACGSCHSQDLYRGTPRECEACHARVRPADHYPGACELCHGTSAWTPATFNHAGFTDCAACHTKARPAQHYPGQCSDCHSTSAWTPATFNHAGFTDCQACHRDVRPAQHYDGQCGLCHSTSAWTPATFNHGVVAGVDCAQCHQPPANHWPAPCTRCHADTGNWRNASFDHSVIGGADCATCHQPPANHYAGACRNCHGDTGNWRNASFDHSAIGGADCSTCHQPPANHFPGACRDCHSDTGNWRNATFNHSFPINHHGANGNCATCHPGNNYASWTCAACHDQGKMDEKHKEINGYTGNCLACHADGRKP